MKTIFYYGTAVILFLIGLLLFWLTNSGALTFAEPYIIEKSQQLSPVPDVTAFTNVNVIPMNSEVILSEQTVIVENGRIIHLGATSNTAIPENALVVAGNGRYLLPGLTDTHVHIKNENELLLFVAHGVTSVRDMWGTTGWQLTVGYPDQLQMRQQITDGTLLGPSIYTTGPIMEGAPATSPLMSVLDSPEAAIESVNWQAAQGYDYVKVYDHLTPEMYDAIVETAVSHNLPIVGHTPAAVGLDTVLSSGQTTIEHLTGYIDPDAAQFIIPENKLDEYAARTRKAGVWNAPTLGLFTKVVSNDGIRQLESRPELQLVPPNIRLLWPLFVQQLRKGLTYEGDDYPERIAALNTRMVQALNDANAGIILGTDTDNPYLIPGLSALEELELLVEAGLTPYQALAAGTSNAAAALGHPGEFGIVAVGARADLLLLNQNPLKSISHVYDRAGVMVNGRWLPEAELHQMRAELVESYESEWIDWVWAVLVMGTAVVMIIIRTIKLKKVD